MLTIAIERYTK